jgi:hypothetical protein
MGKCTIFFSYSLPLCTTEIFFKENSTISWHKSRRNLFLESCSTVAEGRFRRVSQFHSWVCSELSDLVAAVGVINVEYLIHSLLHMVSKGVILQMLMSAICLALARSRIYFALLVGFNFEQTSSHESCCKASSMIQSYISTTDSSHTGKLSGNNLTANPLHLNVIRYYCVCVSLYHLSKSWKIFYETFRRYHIFWELVSLKRGALSLMSTVEELLERKSSGFGLENRDYDRRDPSRWPRVIHNPQNWH